MGTFSYNISIRSPETGESQDVEALVDTGATFTSIPASILEALGVAEARQVEVQLADGRIVQTPLGYVEVQVDDQSTISPCLFGQPGWPALLGAITMESLLIAPDPVGKRFISAPGLLLAQR